MRGLTCLIEGVDVSSTLEYSWTVDIPSSDLDLTSEWVFRFVPAGSVASFQQVSSSIVFIREAGQSTTSTHGSNTATGGASPSVVPTMATSRIGETASPSIELVPAATNSAPSVESRSKAWIAGPVVGSVVGTGLISVSVILFWHRRIIRRRDKNPEIAQLHSDCLPHELGNTERQKPVETIHP